MRRVFFLRRFRLVRYVGLRRDGWGHRLAWEGAAIVWTFSPEETDAYWRRVARLVVRVNEGVR